MVMGHYTDAEVEELCRKYCNPVVPIELETTHKKNLKEFLAMHDRICRSQIKYVCRAGWLDPEKQGQLIPR